MGVPATLISLALFGTRSGLNTLDIVDNFINNLGVVGSAIVMSVIAATAGGRLRSLRKHLNSVSSVKVPRLWEYVVGVGIPLALAFMMVSALITLITEGYGDYPAWYVGIFGWGCIVFALVASGVFTLLPWRHRPVTSLKDSETVEETPEVTP